ncbi:MAG: hypothetical protein K9I47_11940 [Bacteroidales bacterium]|nr:hypothetical protein [Bacteroidales bacterium]
MMKRDKNIKLFFIWLALAVFVGHSVVPHLHHSGDEPSHLQNHFASHDSHRSLILHFHHQKTDKDDENACHFNPNPLPVVKDQLNALFLNAGSISTQPFRTSEKLFYSKNSSNLPDHYHETVLPRGPPAFYC